MHGLPGTKNFQKHSVSQTEAISLMKIESCTLHVLLLCKLDENILQKCFRFSGGEIQLVMAVDTNDSAKAMFH